MVLGKRQKYYKNMPKFSQAISCNKFESESEVLQSLLVTTLMMGTKINFLEKTLNQFEHDGSPKKILMHFFAEKA
jgi:hypothetical protein